MNAQHLLEWLNHSITEAFDAELHCHRPNICKLDIMQLGENIKNVASRFRCPLKAAPFNYILVNDTETVMNYIKIIISSIFIRVNVWFCPHLSISVKKYTSHMTSCAKSDLKLP